MEESLVELQEGFSSKLLDDFPVELLETFQAVPCGIFSGTQKSIPAKKLENFQWNF